MDSEDRKMLAKNDRLSQYDPRIFGEKHVKKHLATWTLDEKWGSETWQRRFQGAKKRGAKRWKEYSRDCWISKKPVKQLAGGLKSFSMY